MTQSYGWNLERLQHSRHINNQRWRVTSEDTALSRYQSTWIVRSQSAHWIVFLLSSLLPHRTAASYRPKRVGYVDALHTHTHAETVWWMRPGRRSVLAWPRVSDPRLTHCHAVATSLSRFQLSAELISRPRGSATANVGKLTPVNISLTLQCSDTVGCLGVRKSIRPVKTEWWGVGVVVCLERGADCLRMVQLMPQPSPNPIISCLI